MGIRWGIVSVVAAVGFAAPVQAEQVMTVSYTCNIEGAPAQLTAQVRAVSSTGVFIDPSGGFGGSIQTGDVNYFYQGTLVSASSRYTFEGTNQYADFVDLSTNDRFRVQMNVQGPMLEMIINPQGPGPVQYMCQRSG